MDVQSQLLLLGVLPDIYRIMVAERERVSRLVLSQTSTPKVSLSRPTATGKGRVVHTQDYSSEGKALMREIIHGLLKPAGNVASRQRISFTFIAVKHTK